MFFAADPAGIVTSMNTVRISGTVWGAVLTYARAELILALRESFAATLNLPIEWIQIVQLTQGSLIVDYTVTRNGTLAIDDNVINGLVLASTFDKPVALYRNITLRTDEVISVLSASTLVPSTKPAGGGAGCTGSCLVALGAGIGGGVVAIFVGIFMFIRLRRWCRNRQRLKQLAGNGMGEPATWDENKKDGSKSQRPPQNPIRTVMEPFSQRGLDQNEEGVYYFHTDDLLRQPDTPAASVFEAGDGGVFVDVEKPFATSTPLVRSRPPTPLNTVRIRIPPDDTGSSVRDEAEGISYQEDDFDSLLDDMVAASASLDGTPMHRGTPQTPISRGRSTTTTAQPLPSSFIMESKEDSDFEETLGSASLPPPAQRPGAVLVRAARDVDSSRIVIPPPPSIRTRSLRRPQSLLDVQGFAFSGDPSRATSPLGAPSRGGTPIGLSASFARQVASAHAQREFSSHPAASHSPRPRSTGRASPSTDVEEYEYEWVFEPHSQRHAAHSSNSSPRHATPTMPAETAPRFQSETLRIQPPSFRLLNGSVLKSSS